jgi:hypothetical protein
MKLFLFPKVFLSAEGDISDVHEIGMPLEEWAKACKNDGRMLRSGSVKCDGNDQPERTAA